MFHFYKDKNWGKPGGYFMLENDSLDFIRVVGCLKFRKKAVTQFGTESDLNHSR